MRRNKTPLLTLIAFAFVGFGTANTFSQETYSVTAVGGPAQVVSGVIRWKKVFGTVPITNGLSAQDPNPCSAFYVIAVTADEEQTVINSDNKLTWKPKAGDFNICEYKMSVASNTPMRVYAGIGKFGDMTEQQTLLYWRAAWIGGTKPETGYKRGFVTNRYDITLSPFKPIILNFEMAYVLNRFQHLKYTIPPPPPPKPPYIVAGPVIIPGPGWPFGSVYLGWDGGPDNPNVEIWVSVNNGPETAAYSIDFPPGHPVFKQPKASIEMKLPRNSGLYKYVLKAAGKALSSVSFFVP